MSPSLTCLLAAALFATDVPRDQIQRDDLEQLQGTWKVEKVETAGQVLPANALGELRMVFEGNNLTMMMDKTAREKSRFTLMEGEPPGIDIEQPRGAGMETVKGIYRLEEDMLTICTNEGGGGQGMRPKNFETKGNDRVVLIVLKRVSK
ncbi:MAG TPA: TIGR03067 domain-containing protein [Gemmataceae bacterium]|nr:TIGR03067 domain-containing protein [Gemmataceae bacterium]